MQFILEEDRDHSYGPRTEVNARESDVTFAIAINFDSAGEKLTRAMAKKHGKVYIKISPEGDVIKKAEQIALKLNQEFDGKQKAITLNIAGNGICTMRGILDQQQCDDFTYNLLFALIYKSPLIPRIKTIRSGGQSGFDEAGIKAGIKLQLDTTAYYPRGYRIRDLKGDRTQTREEVFKSLGVKQRIKVFVDMDGVLCDFKKSYLQWKSDYPEIQFPQSQFGFFSNLEPIRNAVEGFKKLQEHFDVYILTRPSIYNLMCYTEKADWIKRHLGFHVLENFITMCDKSIVNGKGAYLIDDTVQAGQLDFEGTLLQFGSEEFPDWNSIIKKLIK